MNINEQNSTGDIEKGVKTYINSAEFKSKIEKIVKDRLKNDADLQDEIVAITRNVITQLYKTLWVKRNFWLQDLKNRNN